MEFLLYLHLAHRIVSSTSTKSHKSTPRGIHSRLSYGHYFFCINLVLDSQRGLYYVLNWHAHPGAVSRMRQGRCAVKFQSALGGCRSVCCAMPDEPSEAEEDADTMYGTDSDTE
jgi:hypothetical protein